MTENCEHCEQPYKVRHPFQRYCSAGCRAQAQRKRHNAKYSELRKESYREMQAKKKQLTAKSLGDLI